MGVPILGPNSKNVQPEVLRGDDSPEKRLLRRAFRLFETAKEQREPIAMHWPRYYRQWATDAWKDIHVDEWRSRPQVNFTFSTIELEVATLTDQDPQVIVFPRNDDQEDTEVAQVLNAIYANSWRVGKGRLSLKNIVRNSKIYGTGIAKSVWSEDRDDVAILSVRPDQFYPDPSATSIEDMWYCFHVYEVSANDIKQNWPERSHLVKAETLGQLGQFDRDVWSSVEEGGPFGGEGRLTHTEGTSTHTTITKVRDGGPFDPDTGTVTLMEFWERLPDSNGIRLHYIANNIHLESVEDPLGSRFKKFPFVRFLHLPVDGEFWGMSMIQPIEPLQLSINKRRQQIIDNLRILGNPPILADLQAGLEEDLILGAPGEIIQVAGGVNAVKWLESPAMPQGLFELQQLDKSEFETITGNFDVVQGRTPTGIEAAAAIAELQEAAQVRIRDRVALMEDGIEDLARLMLLLIQSNYTEEKTLMLLGKEGVLEERRINQPLTPDLAQTAIDEELEAAVDLENVERALDVTRGDFDVQLKTGSTLPISKVARLNEAVLLFDRGIADAEEVLTAINHPRKSEILKRLQAAQGGGAAGGDLEALLGGGLGSAETQPGVGDVGGGPPVEETPPIAPSGGLI